MKQRMLCSDKISYLVQSLTSLGEIKRKLVDAESQQISLNGASAIDKMVEGWLAEVGTFLRHNFTVTESAGLYEAQLSAGDLGINLLERQIDAMDQYLHDLLMAYEAADNAEEVARAASEKRYWEQVHGAIEVLHVDVQRVSRKLFYDGHFSKAATAALLAVNERVKKMTQGKLERTLDGAALFRQALSDRGVVALGDLSSEDGRNIQNGYRDMLVGSWVGIRNPNSHSNKEMSPRRALHAMFLASELMLQLDEAKVSDGTARMPGAQSRDAAQYQRLEALAKEAAKSALNEEIKKAFDSLSSGQFA